MIYACAYPKGGTGKSTLSVHLSAHLARQGATLLIDGDHKQESASKWAHWRSGLAVGPSPTTICLTDKAIYRQGRDLAARYDHTVIDVGGRTDVALRAALALADRVIVPLGLSGFDGAELRAFLQVAEEVSVGNPGMELRAVVCKATGPQKSRKATQAREFIAARGLPVFRQAIRHRAVYQDAVTEGRTVHEYRPRNADANGEMRRLYAEIEAWQVPADDEHPEVIYA